MILGVYALIFAGMAISGWWGLIWYWIIPLFLGEPVMRFIRMTEHVGRPEVAQMSDNTRTNLVSAPWRFLCWNMNYHAEHHYVASVPYHALPRLHALIKDDLPPANTSILDAYREMIPALIRQRHVPGYHIRKVLPATAQPFRAEFHALDNERP